MNAFRDYQMFGISFRSEIPLSFPEQSTGVADITLKLASAQWFENASGGARPSPEGVGWYERVVCRNGSDYLRWPGLFEFLVSPDGRTIACRPLENSSAESFQSYLLGQVLSYALIKQGHEPLHATAIVIDGAAVAFLGASGQGKSTLAAAFLSAGCRLLTDDLLVIRDVGGVLCGFPGPPRIKLFPGAARRFLPDEASLARMNPDSNKFIIGLPPKYVHPTTAPVRACFILDGLDDGKLQITTLSGAPSCMALLGATFNKRLVGAARLQRQFVTARHWAERIPVKRVRYAWRIDAIEDVVRAISEDVNTARELVV
jgi:hypothetical protein